MSSHNVLAQIYRRSASFTRLVEYQRLLRSDFVQKVAETFANRILLIGIGLITGVIVARILGPEGRGLYAVAMVTSAVGAQFGNLGLHASNTYYVARDRALLPALVGNSLVVSLGLGGAGVLLAWFFFLFRPDFAPVSGLLLGLALVSIPFGLAYILLQNLLLGIQEIRTYNRIERMTKIIGVGLIGAVILLQLVTVERIFLAGLIALIISFAWALKHLLPFLNRFPRPSWDVFANSVRYGLKAYLAALFAFLVLRIDLLMIKQLLGAEQAGYYSIAANMADMVYMLPVVIGTILFPKLAALSDNRQKWRLTRQVTLVVGLIMLVLAGGAAFVAKWIVGVLYGEAFLPAVPAFWWLMPGIVFLSIQVVAVQFLNSVGFPKVVVGIWGGASILNVILNMWAIPHYGISGAAIVSTLSYSTVFFLIMVVIISRVIKKS